MRRTAPDRLAPLALVLLVACGDNLTPPGDPFGGQPDPFAAQPDTSEGLTNVSADLAALLEGGTLSTACAEAAAAPADRAKRLRCGKAMFFYEGFATAGVPAPLVRWLLDGFPVELGPGFAALGMIPDPFSAAGLPLGLAAGGAAFGDVPTYAFTCASCHVAQLADGRYAVGAPNHAFAYGTLNLAFSVLPALVIPGADPADHDPAAIAALQPLRDRLAAEPALGNSLLTALIPLIESGAMLPPFSVENEHHYASWRTGTMDFFIQPLPIDDEVHTISKISALWGIPTDAELTRHALGSAMLGWTGGTGHLATFVTSFVELGGGDLAPWPADRLAPLVEYVESLRAPAPSTPPAAAPLARGQAVFGAACLTCHGGPRGMGDRVYTFDEIGTDAAIQWWADGPDHDGALCCGMTLPAGDAITHGLKSPRLVGLDHMTRFLHNGSLDSLEQLLCLEPRPGVTELAYGDAGHEAGCELPAADRRALIAFLRAQ